MSPSQKATTVRFITRENQKITARRTNINIPPSVTRSSCISVPLRRAEGTSERTGCVMRPFQTHVII